MGLYFARNSFSPNRSFQEVWGFVRKTRSEKTKIGQNCVCESFISHRHFCGKIMGPKLRILLYLRIPDNYRGAVFLLFFDVVIFYGENPLVGEILL